MPAPIFPQWFILQPCDHLWHCFFVHFPCSSFCSYIKQPLTAYLLSLGRIMMKPWKGVSQLLDYSCTYKGLYCVWRYLWRWSLHGLAVDWICGGTSTCNERKCLWRNEIGNLSFQCAHKDLFQFSPKPYTLHKLSKFSWGRLKWNWSCVPSSFHHLVQKDEAVDLVNEHLWVRLPWRNSHFFSEATEFQELIDGHTSPQRNSMEKFQPWC